MARRNPSRKPNAELIKQKREEKVAEAQALADIELDSEEFKRLVAGKAIEQAVDSQARLHAYAQLRRQREKEESERHSVFPFDIEALRRPDNGRVLYEASLQRSEATARNVKSTSERNEILEKKLHEARRLTLGLAVQAKDILTIHDVAPDTEVIRTRTTQEKKWQGIGKFVLDTGKIKNPVIVQQHAQVADGWLLEFSNARRATGKVVLCEDGRLLAVNGTVDEAPAQNSGHAEPMRRLHFEDASGGAEFIDDRPGPDAAAPPLIPTFENNPYSHTVDMLTREAAIQDAIVNLLVSKGVEIPDTDPTTSAHNPKP